MDFNKLLTPEQKQNIKRREQDIARRTIGNVTAFDTAGNRFEKTVILSPDLKIISFGGFCEYYLDDTYEHMLSRPDAQEFIIDIGGRNHKGYQVSIPISIMLDIFEKAIELREKLDKSSEV